MEEVEMTTTISNVTVGKADVSIDKPTHVKGVPGGNDPRRVRKDGRIAKANARRSTSINPERRDPIDPRMPNLPPA
jgi:hypothetical protein